MIKVISIDPGKTTGLAKGTIPDNESKQFPMKITVDQQEFTCSQLWFYLNLEKPTYLVCESFEYRPKYSAEMKVELFSRNLIGVIQLYHELHDIELTMQTASQAKVAFKDDILKRDGLWVKGKPHSRDALRHLMYWYNFGYGYQFNSDGWKLVGDRDDQAGE